MNVVAVFLFFFHFCPLQTNIAIVSNSECTHWEFVLKLTDLCGPRQVDGVKRMKRRSSGLERGGGQWVRRGEGGSRHSDSGSSWGGGSHAR